ncbi:MAG: fimbrillin family protein [Dysgonamonadaceae bacterium]|nr:fimbrillin family protein [Dysgonamonadaceae bacterium]
MKQLFFAASITMLLLSACSQDDAVVSDNTAALHGSSTLRLISHPAPELRTAIGDKTGNSYPVWWVDGDALGLFSNTAGATINNIEALLSDGAGSNSGTFIAEGISLAASGSTEILIYYPHKWETELDGSTISSELPTQQQQSFPNNSDHIGRYGFAYAKTTVDAATATANFTLNHAMAYVKFVISSSELASCKLKSVSLFDKKTQTPLSGTFSVDYTDNSLTRITSNPYATVSIATPQNLSSAQEIYLTTYPADLAGKEVYVVITLENDLKTITIPIAQTGKALKANAVNVIAVNNLTLSDNSCEWYEPVETRLLCGGWAYGDANCIMTAISPSGVNNVINVKARGNFMEVEEPKYAGTVFNCDLNNDHKMVGVNGFTDNFSPVAGDYTITVNAYSVDGGYPGGCGQVAIYGEDQTTVLWSFIIWMTPDIPAEHPYGNTGYVVQDRNIGSYTIEDNWKTNGVYFQWGRPTPFGWGSKGYLSKSTEATNVRFSIEHPRHQLCTQGVANTKADWYLGAWTGARTDRKDDFWGNPNESSTYLNPNDGHKSIYDPCPKGFRVVSPKVLAEVESKGVVEERTNTYAIKYSYDGTHYAYWPFAGCRYGEVLTGSRTADNAKTSTNYWSNSPATNYSDDSNMGGSTMSYQHASQTWTHSAGRSHAFSVRCMRDTENR